MILGKTDQTNRKEAADSHDDRQAMPAKASLWARMKEKTAMALAVVGISAGVAAGCTYEMQGLEPLDIPDASVEDAGYQEDGGEIKDSGTDAGNDGGNIDSGYDGGEPDGGVVDAGEDAGFDAGADAGLDAGLDAGVDAGSDAGLDAGVDAGVDAGNPDGGPAVCPSATTGNYSGQVTNTAPKVIGGFGFLYKGKFGTDAIVDITCDANGAPIISGLICPQGVATSFDVSQDGKKITITNTYAGINAMNGVFVVTNL